ncbi:MAG: DUF2783 domain-containing protein [Alphaproteobacteria bacterium]|nr:DUF2783 domain-containing protein [Alphaproteobacteria bacterium]
MAALATDLRIADPDEIYARLVAAHRGLDARQGRVFDAKLILLLANQVGDMTAIGEAIAAAREGLSGATSDGG